MPLQQQLRQRTEELNSMSPCAAEPGGKLGALDPTQPLPSSSTDHGEPHELDVDPDLRAALAPLLAHTRARLQEAHKDTSPHAVASAAVAAAEASGALPPLAGHQREALEGFFAQLAEGMHGGDGGGGAGTGGFERFGSSGGEALYGEEDAALRIRPHTTELLEAVVNKHLSRSGAARCSASPADSVKAGGEVGNITLQSDTHHEGEPRGVPAESGTDRAERQAERDFEQLELADLPHSQEAQPRSSQGSPGRSEANAPVQGDAPAPGGGLQVGEAKPELGQVRDSGSGKYSGGD